MHLITGGRVPVDTTPGPAPVCSALKKCPELIIEQMSCPHLKTKLHCRDHWHQSLHSGRHVNQTVDELQLRNLQSFCTPTAYQQPCPELENLDEFCTVWTNTGTCRHKNNGRVNTSKNCTDCNCGTSTVLRHCPTPGTCRSLTTGA